MIGVVGVYWGEGEKGRKGGGRRVGWELDSVQFCVARLDSVQFCVARLGSLSSIVPSN